MVKVFVYGSLKTDQRNAWVMYEIEAQYQGRASLDGYALWDTGKAVPAIVKGEGVVAGEVWEVSEDDLVVLDLFEGPMYSRTPVTVQFGGRPVSAYAYVWQGAVSALVKRVKGGDWTTVA